MHHNHLTALTLLPTLKFVGLVGGQGTILGLSMLYGSARLPGVVSPPTRVQALPTLLREFQGLFLSNLKVCLLSPQVITMRRPPLSSMEACINLKKLKRIG